MGDRMVQISDNFWNIRGSFRLGGLVDVGTQASLVRLTSGRFVFLDAYTTTGEVDTQVRELTDNGHALQAILNLHPFHTVHVARVHARYPHAELYGTARHASRAPELPWQPLRTEQPELHAAFAEDFDFSVPEGVDFISANENVHFASVLAYHRPSKCIHVDDTFNYVRLPGLASRLGLPDVLRFHPTLSLALQRRPGAAADFRRWAEALIAGWGDAEHMCAAHVSALQSANNAGPPLRARMADALARVEGTLRAHTRKHG